MNIQKQQVFYDQLWSHNEKLNSLNLRRAVKILSYFVDLKKQFKNPKVIDLGCGEGRFAAFLGEFGYVDALELSTRAVESAKKLYYQANYIQGNALTYDFKGNSYDVVISQEVIEHIEDQMAYIEVCYKILNEGGYLILTTPNKKVLDAMKDGKKWSNQPIENVLTPKELKSLLKTKFEIKNYDSIVLNFGSTGIFRLINSRIIIGGCKRIGLSKLREILLGKLGFGLHQCVLVKKI